MNYGDNASNVIKFLTVKIAIKMAALYVIMVQLQIIIVNAQKTLKITIDCFDFILVSNLRINNIIYT